MGSTIATHEHRGPRWRGAGTGVCGPGARAPCAAPPRRAGRSPTRARGTLRRVGEGVGDGVLGDALLLHQDLEERSGALVHPLLDSTELDIGREPGITQQAFELFRHGCRQCHPLRSPGRPKDRTPRSGIGTSGPNTEGRRAARLLKERRAGRVESTGWVNNRQALASLPRPAGRFGAAHSSSFLDTGEPTKAGRLGRLFGCTLIFVSSK